MRCKLPVLVAILATIAPGTPALADLRADIAQCAAIVDDEARLVCFDALAAASGQGALDPGERRDLEAALKREFRFDTGLMTGPFSFRIAVSGDLQISRSTAAAREVERLVRRIGRALGEYSDWGVAVTVHGAQVAFSRGHPYSGAELAAQAQTGLARTDLDSERYSIEIGTPAAPLLWDDGRIRSANEHILVEITGLD
ncbi:MAG: hypothetical protein VW644_12545 [Alphaproteobacteria bacterium]|jgi:hypothetical protein